MPHAEQRFRVVVEQMPVVTYVCDYDAAALRYVSPQIGSLTGRPAEWWLSEGGPLRAVLHPGDHDRVVAELQRCVRGEVPFEAEYRMVRPDGAVVVVWDRQTIVRDGAGRPVSRQGILLDVTHLRRTEEALAASEKLHRSTVQAIDEGVMVIDGDGVVLSCNGGAGDLLGFDPEELIGGPPPIGGIYLADGTQVPDPVPQLRQAASEERTSRDDEVRLVRADGEERWVSVNSQPLGDGRGLVWTMTDVSERRRHDERLAHIASHDRLTGLPNRAQLEEHFAPALARARREGYAAALLHVDLDDFKVVNDSLGHGGGDELLRQVAGRLSRRTRAGEMLFRHGGDEFLVLVPDLGGDAGQKAGLLATDLLGCLEEPFSIQGSEFDIGATIGIALYPRDGEHPEEMLKRADSALRAAKRDERGSVAFYTARTDDTAGRLTFSSRLRRGLAGDEFELHYQPVYSLAKGVPVGAEALLRWHDPERGLLSPGDFIPLAEESGLIEKLGAWVVEAVLAQADEWHAQRLDPLVAFNVSPRQLRRSAFATDVGRRLASAGVDPSRISVEITESAAMGDPRSFGAEIGRLHDLGLRLAIDDFGADFSSLSRLRSLPVDTLKIDRSFLRGVPESPDAAATVTAIIGLAEALRMEAVAEGVETEAQLQFLIEQGCPLAQGFHLARPMPAPDFTALLRGSAVAVG